MSVQPLFTPLRMGDLDLPNRIVMVTALEERGIAADNLRDWPSDCLRHTFASCHYAAFKNAGDSAEQLGHGGDLTIFFRHYRGRIREPEAREYWEIYPRSPQPFSVVAA